MDELEELIWGELIKNPAFHPERSAVAHKGGIFESPLLAKLGVLSFNLEQWGCPKYEDLVKTNKEADYYDCKCHVYQPHPKFVENHGDSYHCSASEVGVFKYLLENHLLSPQ
jgi:hypothetical protein